MYLLSDDLNSLANLKNPLSEDEVILYDKKVDDLNKIKNEINHINKNIESVLNKFDNLFEIKGFLLGVYIFIIGIFIINNFQTNTFGDIIGLAAISFFATICLILFVSILVMILKAININGVNISQIFQYSEVKSAQETRSFLYEKINILNKIIAEIETKIFKYYTNQLEIFFNNYLYKKRSANIHFQIALSTFSKLLNSLEELNKSLITPYLKIQLRDYKNYVLDRKINSGSYNLVSQFNSKDVLENKSEDKKRTNTTTLYVDSKTPYISPVNSVLKKIESTKTTPPEYLYKNFRTIYNWDEINKNKKETGIKGEYVVLELEKYFLESIGKKDLADKIRHVSVEDGDGIGYDILSFFQNGNEKYIEVKSTTGNATTPFYMSQNELNFLQSHYSNAVIYRVLITENEPKLKIYSSEQILTQFDIIPSQYKVKPKF